MIPGSMMSPDSTPRPWREQPERFRIAVRLGALLLAAVVACLGPLVRAECGRIIPALSPFLSVCSAIARRGTDFLFLLGLPLLVLAFFRGHWFCRRLCPTGTVAWLAGRLRPGRRAPALPRACLGPWLAALALGGAIAGLPWFLWLDPLAMWNGFFSAFRPGRIGWAETLFGLGLALVAASGFVFPHLWCERLCPLGAFQNGLGSLGARVRRRLGPIPDRDCGPAGGGLRRRGFLGIGVALGALAALGGRGRASAAPVRPPGAAPGNSFLGLCSRCGACFRACPHGIIEPDLGEGGFAALLAPRLRFDGRYCSEWCRECTRVCPTGAIRGLSLEAKRRTALGLAVVNRDACLAWTEGQHCMICDEYCPYDAIVAVTVNGISCPTVDEKVCAGCGACESQCPVSPEKAIQVRGHAVQKAALPREAED